CADRDRAARAAGRSLERPARHGGCRQRVRGGLGEEERMLTQNSALRPPAETTYADELARLAAHDQGPRPAGWSLSPKAVRRFLIGDAALKIGRKFYGDDALVERAIVDLMGEQGLMLVGEPGTAKSMLSELLAVAVSGRSNLVVQGSA